jgi:hypothetical protein
MATSDTAICNIALRMLRAQPITALTDTAERAQMLTHLYADARDFNLALHPWNFATRRVHALNRNAAAPAYGLQYAYALPADPYCLRVLAVNDGGEPFKIEGRDLLTDADAVDLRFIGRITDTTLYAPGFVQMFATYLAAQLAQPLTGSQSTADALLTRWDLMASRARMLDGIEDAPEDFAVSPFVAIRS